MVCFPGSHQKPSPGGSVLRHSSPGPAGVPQEIEVDDVDEFEGGDSAETATDEREFDPEGDTICGNDETGEEWTC